MSAFNQQDILQSIPPHLRQFVVEQDYTKYTAQDHAVWRFIMRQQKKHLSRYAHEVYLEGLEKTGISIDHIPSIEDMNVCLGKFGWRAVVIDGYIPTSAFMEFHSHKIMPIALDMRSVEHILYTPTPDIVHEAGGHAIFLSDVDYNEYLQKFGEYGLKAISNRQDEAIYEAIRDLSILKEDPRSTAVEIQKSEEHLSHILSVVEKPSESALLGRLYWWTVEYGLVGTVQDYRIFGAGLLSSLGESRSCLDDQVVKKIPYAVDADKISFDITKEQPQLFVTKSCKHMMQVLEEFAENMCFRVGGTSSIRQAIEAETVCTSEYCSGLQVSGQFVNVLTNSVDREIYIQTKGPTQLSYKNLQLSGHGVDYHSQGFGSPVGGLQGIDKPLESLSVDELKSYQIVIDKKVCLEFLSGITVQGILKNITRRDGKNLLFSFDDCTVKTWEGHVLFQPEWGMYDMAVGRRIASVFAGSADRTMFDTYPEKSKRTVQRRVLTTHQTQLFAAYQSVRDMRNSSELNDAEISRIVQQILPIHPENWLIRCEMLELLDGATQFSEITQKLRAELLKLRSKNESNQMLIDLAFDSRR